MNNTSESTTTVPRVSVIIPTFNEVERVTQAVERAWNVGDEVIVVDGGSTDGTIDLAKSLRCQLVEFGRGRGQQLNAGSRLATGSVLLFLHADNWLEIEAKNQIVNALENCEDEDAFFGGFCQNISGKGIMYRLIEKGNFSRARWQKLIYGDQGMFISRSLFNKVGGFPEISLMEDFEISQKLKRMGRPVLLEGPIHVDARRWEQHGPLRLTIRNWMFAIGYRCGVSPETLASIYHRRKA